VTLGEAIAAAASVLAAAGVDQPRREARLLAAHALGAPANALLDPARPLSTGDSAALAALAARRGAREPLAFITRRRGFWTLDLEVSPDTLIPRADSETLIEAAIADLAPPHAVHRILDLGTGTGCLLLAALREFTAAFGVGVDLSPAAARLAARNASGAGLADRATFLAGDWAAALCGRFDLVLCNPPYIATAAIAGLMPEVARHEPARALDGGPAGLDAYARLVPTLARLLTPHGLAVLELGAGQGPAVAALAEGCGLAHVRTRPDLGGVDRALVLARRDKKPFGNPSVPR
jgi:release factor glutamine methyltransferase